MTPVDLDEDLPDEGMSNPEESLIEETDSAVDNAEAKFGSSNASEKSTSDSNSIFNPLPIFDDESGSPFNTIRYSS